MKVREEKAESLERVELKGETDGQWPCNGDIRYGEFRGAVFPRQWVIASLVCGSPDTAGGSKGRRTWWLVNYSSDWSALWEALLVQ